MKIARSGYKTIFLFVIVSAALIVIFKSFILTVILTAACVWCAAFFRDPEREIPQSDVIVSPADGKIIKITETENFKGEKARAVSVFMNIFNVHVNRMPYSGKIEEIVHTPGRFLAADKEEASFENENVYYKIKTEAGYIELKQIAGLIARRIVSYAREGQEFKKGDRIGLIKFGSRVDITFPECFKLNIKIGDKVHAGSSILALKE